MNSHYKVAIVTGAGTGIGKVVATVFLQEGYRVALAGRRKEPLEQAVMETGSSGAQALIVPTDMRDQHPCARCSPGPRRPLVASTAVQQRRGQCARHPARKPQL